MRRWLAFLLIALLPYQFVWAAAAPYCQHEATPNAQHLGHHEHEHKAATASTSDSHDVAKTIKLLGDSDCGYCHLSCGQFVETLSFAFSALPPSPGLAEASATLPSRDPDPLERPNWRLA